MDKGIEIRDISVGAGEEALQGKIAVLNLRMFLHHGEEVFVSPEPRVEIPLYGRHCIAGLLKGIIGMRVGGTRSMVVSPHLAYGAQGIPGKIPPNALLRCEVELVDVREPNTPGSEDKPPIRYVIVYHPGEAARNLPRWQLRISEDGSCGAGLWFPIPGMTWRHTRRRQFTIQLATSLAAELLDEAAALPARFPKECLSTNQLWADISEQANSITRDSATNTLCLTIDFWERNQHNYYRMRENSPALNKSELYRVINSLIQPQINAGSAAQSVLRPKGRLPD
ncbi:MAG TPA: FKBP-type peptidyl-prolyl cis-trans isomerase [Terracidiphilus sp.]|jgi:hypothetical protein